MGGLAARILDCNLAGPPVCPDCGQQPVDRDAEGNIRLCDGTVTLMLTKSQVRPKNGVQYFGIQVSELASLKKRLQDGSVAISESAQGQIQFNDPEGNRVVVSESGWAN